MNELEVLKRRLERERQARLQAEAIMEKKASELFEANERLRVWNEQLELQVRERTLQLQESETKYRSIIENMALGLMEVDNNDVIQKAYEHFCHMVGYTESELVGRRASEVFLDETFHTQIAEQNQNRQAGQTGVYEVPIRAKHGQMIWVLVSGAPIHNMSGEVIGSIGIHYDISDKKQLIEDLNKAKHIAEEAQIAEKQFLANMSHEIRTPLNAIIGMAHLLYDTQPTLEQKEYLDVLRNAGNFLHSLISDILDMTKIEAGHLEMVLSEFDLAGIIRTHQKAFEIKLEGRPIDVEALIDARIEGNFQGDELLLNQVLNNLLSNAEKFTQTGTIGVRVKQLHKQGEDVMLQFQVYDTGIGISEEDIAIIFDKFKQVNLRDRHKVQGTGLGLAIVKQLIELMGGEISVQSRLNEGTVFTFNLPLKRVALSQAATLPSGGALPASSFVGMTVLVVEDNAMNRKYIGTLLDRWQIQYDYAFNGRESLGSAAKKKYDLIFMDLQMPIMDGYEATISIRSTHNPNQFTPIVALTASAMNSQRTEALDVGMDGFLSKPFTPKQLQEVLLTYQTAPVERVVPVSLPAIRPDPVADPLDSACLEELYGDDRAYAAEMFALFLTDIVPEIEALTDWQEPEELRKALHKLKPTFGMVGLTSLQTKAAALESQCQTGLMAGITPELTDFLSLFKQQLPAVRQYAAQLAAC